MTAARFDPEAILVALEREGVRYVVIGGLAAILQGSAALTQDLDICPANRPKDVAVLPMLRTLLAEIRKRGK